MPQFGSSLQFTKNTFWVPSVVERRAKHILNCIHRALFAHFISSLNRCVWITDLTIFSLLCIGPCWISGSVQATLCSCRLRRQESRCKQLTWLKHRGVSKILLPIVLLLLTAKLLMTFMKKSRPSKIITALVKTSSSNFWMTCQCSYIHSMDNFSQAFYNSCLRKTNGLSKWYTFCLIALLWCYPLTCAMSCFVFPSVKTFQVILFSLSYLFCKIKNPLLSNDIKSMIQFA